MHVDRLLDLDEWRFVFLDTNAPGREETPAGFVRDRDDRVHAPRRGGLLADDAEWLEGVLEDSAGAHVMVWLHHPPLAHPVLAGLSERVLSRDDGRVGIGGLCAWCERRARPQRLRDPT